MDIVTKPALAAKDRLRQTLATLVRLLDQTMNEIQALDSEFQERTAQAVREAEAALERQTAERLQSAIEETEQTTRRAVAEELEARFKQELSDAVETVRRELGAENARLSEESERLSAASAEWDVERTRLMADYQRVNEMLDQSRDEYSRALAETDEAAAIALERQIATAVDRVRNELTSRWAAEKAQLTAEHQKALAEVERLLSENLQKMEDALDHWEKERAQLIAENHRAQKLLSEAALGHEQQLAAAVERVRAELTAEADRLRRELDEARMVSEKLESEYQRLRDEQARQAAGGRARSSGPMDLEKLQAEVLRVEALIQDISRTIDDPEAELSVIIRKNAERAELESYLRGIRFAIPPKL